MVRVGLCLRVLSFLEGLVECARRERPCEIRDQIARFDAGDGLVHGLRPLRVAALLLLTLADSRTPTHIFPAAIAAS